MPEGNVERFIEATEGFNTAAEAAEVPETLRGAEKFIAVMDPKVHFEPQQAALEGGYVGHEGVTRWLADLAQHYAGGQLHYDEVRDLKDRVLALGKLRIVGRGSGIEAEVPIAILASFRDGLITHFKDYGDRGAALEAAGLSE